MIEFLHTFLPSSVALQLGSLTIHWYGITMVLGMVAGILLLQVTAKHIQHAKDEVYDLAFYVILASLLGARIYAVFLELPYYMQHPDQIIAVWNGGLAIHGGIIGGILALYFYCKKKKHNVIKWADAFAPALALGQVFGRWGNYFNQELFGKPTDAPWGIPINIFNRPQGFKDVQYFHPTFLYESILNLINFILLFVIFKKVYNKNSKLKPGTVVSIYFITYGVIRIIMEQLRIDSTAVVLGVRVPVIASAVLIVLGIISLLYTYRNAQK